jgi:hypothetical protein
MLLSPSPPSSPWPGPLTNAGALDQLLPLLHTLLSVFWLCCFLSPNLSTLATTTTIIIIIIIIVRLLLPLPPPFARGGTPSSSSSSSSLGATRA